MTKVILLLVGSIAALSTLTGRLELPQQENLPQQTSLTAAAPAMESNINVTIATIGSYLGPPTNHYKVGDQIPVAITMTNNSSAPVSACISSDLYQNLPKLTKDGQLVPYMKWQSYERLLAQRDNTCKDLNVPEPVLLMPNKPVKADWFVLTDNSTSSGAEAWYDTLSPGKYELTIQRRLRCCDGPMVESNKISFEIDQ
jgi:hypothetical protein